MTEEVNPNQPSKAFSFGSRFRRRLEMMAAARKKKKPGDVIKAASDLAQQSVNLGDKANGESKPVTAYEHGAHLRDILVATGAIVTDTTGKTAEAVVEKAEEDQKKIDEERRKQQEEKYGGPPTVAEVIIHGIGDLGDVKLSRRDLLFGKPKEGVKAVVEELGPAALPFPLNAIAKIFGVFKWWGSKK